MGPNEPFFFPFGQVGELPLIRLSVCQSIREATKKSSEDKWPLRATTNPGTLTNF